MRGHFASRTHFKFLSTKLCQIANLFRQQAVKSHTSTTLDGWQEETCSRAIFDRSIELFFGAKTAFVAFFFVSAIYFRMPFLSRLACNETQAVSLAHAVLAKLDFFLYFGIMAFFVFLPFA